MNWKRILAIGSHTDDCEAGCSGLLSKIVRRNEFEAISVVYFTRPSDADKRIFEDEWRAAIKAWGFDFNDKRFSIRLDTIPVREFTYFRQRILDYLYRMNAEFKPDLVLVPSNKEYHQDHICVTQEANRAFRRCDLLGYEMPMVSLPVDGVLYVPLTKEEADAKLSSISAYNSQLYRSSANVEAIKALMKVRGNQCGHEFAECYEVIREIYNA